MDVDPRTLRLPTSRLNGVDPAKLQRQIAQYGISIAGMPVILVGRGSDGELQIVDGVTRATRTAKLLPGQLARVEIVDDLAIRVGAYPSVQEKLP
jgi:hypothetical protein